MILHNAKGHPPVQLWDAAAGKRVAAWLKEAEAKNEHDDVPAAAFDLAFTPGPVEHVLDLLLADIVAEGKGPVQITFFAEDHYLKVRLPAGVRGDGRTRRGIPPGMGLEEAREVAEAQGGRITGDGLESDLEVLLPRR